ncbi:MAG: nucleoside-diphosphate-sugar epimerase [Candidatus Poriferisodalaceae bacterium]|jgi:D-erythronate 2-dehydrogenase
MHILVTGAAGMIGRKLTARLLAGGELAGQPIKGLHLVDVIPVDVVAGALDGSGVTSEVVDLTEAGAAQTLVERSAADPYDVVFHLAGVVSGEAEVNLAKGLAVNLDGTRALLDAFAAADGCPRIVFTSSIAVFGAPFPDVIPDEFHLTPLTSYGAQKAMCEFLLADYSRRGLINGIGIRLPTISVRPGKPNAAASGFFSGIIREPLAGAEAVLPVSRDVVHTHASPRSAINYLIHAAAVSADDLGPRRNLTMPGVAVTVGEQIEALGRIAGPDAVALIREEGDELVQTIVAGWPTRFSTDRADALGFVGEAIYDEIIHAYIEDETAS